MYLSITGVFGKNIKIKNAKFVKKKNEKKPINSFIHSPLIRFTD